MLLKSKPKVAGEDTANVYEVGFGMWELTLVDEEGVATGPLALLSLGEIMSYLGGVFHGIPIVLHTLSDIEDERRDSMKTVKGTVVSYDAKPSGQPTEHGLMEFQPEGSEKIINISLPSTRDSVGLFMSGVAESLVGKTITAVYEVVYATGGEENLRTLCNLTEG